MAAHAPTTVGGYLEEWLDRHRAHVRPATLKSYRQVVRAYLRPHLGEVGLTQLDTATVEDLYAHLLAGGGLHGKPLSVRSVRYAHAVLRRAMEDARLDGLVEVNPAAAAHPPRGGRGRPGRRPAGLDRQAGRPLPALRRRPPVARAVAPGGWDRGDELLIGVADRLRQAVREQDLVARLGGDEFVVVLTGPRVEDVARGVAQRILELLAEPSLATDVVTVGASVGIALGDGGTRPGQLLRAADGAMYVAKEHGRACYEFAPATGRGSAPVTPTAGSRE